MSRKREARIDYYRGLLSAMDEHSRITEEGLRALPGIDQEEGEKLVLNVSKRHKKLLKAVEQQMKGEGIDPKKVL